MKTLVRPLPLLALFLGVPVLAVVLLGVSGALDAAVVASLGDPGRIATWGLPASRGVRDVAATLTIGLLVIATTATPPTPASDIGDVGKAQLRMISVAAASGALWVWANIAVLAFSYSNLVGRSLLTPGSGSGISYYATSFEGGRLLAATTVLSIVVTIGCLFARRVTHAGLMCLVALAALWPLALSGHVAGATDHAVAANVQYAHLVAVTVWVGGLAALYLSRRSLGKTLPIVANRYSRLAGGAFLVVVTSGVASAVLRLDNLSDLNSVYGLFLVIKAGALAVLGAAGWRQRTRILRNLSVPNRGQIAFATLTGLEIALMAAAMGAAVALAATPPPVTDRPLTSAESLLGHPLPGLLTPADWVSQWQPETFWTPIILAASIAYLAAVVKLRRRGDRWPHSRSLAWLLGTVALVWSTSGPPGIYGDVLFSMHVVQHLTVAAAVPTFLCLGTPITLALRTLNRRTDGSRGPREWLLIAIRSRLLGILSHPLAATAIFIAGPFAFYHSGLIELSMRSHTAHLLMIGYSLVSGYMFATVICGIDRGMRRPAYPIPMMLLMATSGFFALFSMSLMNTETIFAQDWFSSLGRTWGASLQDDQHFGASLAWVLGNYPLAILGGVLFWTWMRGHKDQRVDRHDGHHDDDTSGATKARAWTG